MYKLYTFFVCKPDLALSLHPLLTQLYIIMNTKQALLQFVQQIMHEGIDALIDRIANRVIEKLDEARISMPQTAAEYDEEQPLPKDIVEPQPNNVTEPQLTEAQSTEP